ncbi:hypothetical protein HDU77_011500 [Chytriomyces hyalinus]|nr:hypothetical protein HDU77_011500 [Chytriomyces hyalinus]
MQPLSVLLLVASAICASAGTGSGWYDSPKARYGDVCGTKSDLLAEPFCMAGFQCISYGKKTGNRCTPQSLLYKPCAQALQYPAVCAPGLHCVKSKKKSGGIVGAATGTCLKGHCGKLGDKCNASKPCKKDLMCSVNGYKSVGQCKKAPEIQCLAIMPCPPGFSYWCATGGCQPDCPF